MEPYNSTDGAAGRNLESAAFPGFFPKGTAPELIAAVEDATRNVLDRHGVDAFTAPHKAAVVHEVGHAIVGTHEGFTIRQVTIYSREVPNFGLVWSGRCRQAGGAFTSGPDSRVEDDLRYGRFVIGGLAGEAVMQVDKPGSSLDEVGLSQAMAINIGMKLRDPTLSDEAHAAYVQKLWHEQVWGVAISILYANQEPFAQLANELHQNEKVQGGKLRKILTQVRRIAS